MMSKSNWRQFWITVAIILLAFFMAWGMLAVVENSKISKIESAAPGFLDGYSALLAENYQLILCLWNILRGIVPYFVLVVDIFLIICGNIGGYAPG